LEIEELEIEELIEGLEIEGLENRRLSIWRLTTRWALMWCCLLLWPAGVRAQLTAPREAPSLRLGPIELYPTLQIVDAGKDSNVFEESQNPKEDDTFNLQ